MVHILCAEIPLPDHEQHEQCGGASHGHDGNQCDYASPVPGPYDHERPRLLCFVLLTSSVMKSPQLIYVPLTGPTFQRRSGDLLNMVVVEPLFINSKAGFTIRYWT